MHSISAAVRFPLRCFIRHHGNMVVSRLPQCRRFFVHCLRSQPVIQAAHDMQPGNAMFTFLSTPGSWSQAHTLHFMLYGNQNSQGVLVLMRSRYFAAICGSTD